MNPILVELLRREETFAPMPYQDVAGVWTIGYGHTRGVTARTPGPISHEEAVRLLEEDTASAVADVRRLVRVPLTEMQFAALVSFTFNLGGHNLARSTLLRLTNEGRKDEAAWEFRKWRKAGGEIQPGLLTRRGKEEQLWLLPMGDIENPLTLLDGPDTVA